MTTPDAATFIAALDGLEQSGDARPIAELFCNDARISNPLMSETGKAGAARFWSVYRQDGRVCLEWTSSGEIEGAQVVYEGVSILEVGDGGFSAFRTYFDPTRLAAPRQAQA